MESALKIPEKIFKKPEEPHGTGIMRLQVLNILFSATEPLTISQILQRLTIKPSTKCLYQMVYEIGYAFTGLELWSITCRATRTKAHAFFVTFNSTYNVNIRQQSRGQSPAHRFDYRNDQTIHKGQHRPGYTPKRRSMAPGSGSKGGLQIALRFGDEPGL